MTDFAMIEQAAERLAQVVRRTPILTSPFLDEIAGRKIYLKAECLQHTGSFKFRGAWSAISALPAHIRKKGVLAFSSGNHAQAVAYTAKLHGTSATIIMPSDAPSIKIANTRHLGGDVVLYDRVRESRDEIGARLSTERGLHLVKPYDDPDVLAGQGTCGLEIAAQVPEDEADVYVCCGGGGLTSGIALALETAAPGMRVYPCEPVGFDDVSRSLKSGRIEQNAKLSGSICDAIVTPSPGELTFPILKRLCGSGRTVTDEQALKAVKLAFERLRVVLEPGGAVALASALFNSTSTKPVVVTASGGNIDPELFKRALAIETPE